MLSVTEMVAIGGVLVTAGMALAQLATVRERVAKIESEHARSREAQGGRLEALGQEIASLKARNQVVAEYSRPYDTRGVPPK